MFIQKNFLLIVLALAVVFAFAMRATIFQQQTTSTPTPTNVIPSNFADYWFANKAEVNTYRLEQADYGVLNPGDVVMVFATVNFRTDKQVELDTALGTTDKDKAIPVLKTNIIKKFTTGLHDHSLLTSVFTPINTGDSRSAPFANTLKVSTTSQDWLGHTYLQLNYKNSSYRVQGNSFFEHEVDEAYTVSKATLEDELWNRIRLNPEALPTGETQLIPGTMTARLRHARLDPLPAKLKIDNYEGVLYPGKFLKSYTIEYPTDDRTLIIIFEGQFPHKIVGWEETYKSQDNLLTTRAVLKKSITTDYWNHNAPADSTLRKTLLLNQ